MASKLITAAVLGALIPGAAHAVPFDLSNWATATAPVLFDAGTGMVDKDKLNDNIFNTAVKAFPNQSTAGGLLAMSEATTQLQSAAFGGRAMQRSNCNSCVAFGIGALMQTLTASGASNMVAVGYHSMFGTGSTTATDNVAVGSNSLPVLTSAQKNVCIGTFACLTTTTGSSNVIIGDRLDTLAVSTSNEINIGGVLFLNNNSTAAPAVTACGTSPSIDTRANNRSGTVTVGTATPASCTVTLAGTGYATWNHCRVTSEAVNANFAYSYTLTVLTITGTALAGKIDYDCDGV